MNMESGKLACFESKATSGGGKPRLPVLRNVVMPNVRGVADVQRLLLAGCQVHRAVVSKSELQTVSVALHRGVCASNEQRKRVDIEANQPGVRELVGRCREEAA